MLGIAINLTYFHIPQRSGRKGNPISAFYIDYFIHHQVNCQLLQVLVETLDRCFENVCELDIIFHVDKVSQCSHRCLSSQRYAQTAIAPSVSVRCISYSMRSSWEVWFWKLTLLRSLPGLRSKASLRSLRYVTYLTVRGEWARLYLPYCIVHTVHWLDCTYLTV